MSTMNQSRHTDAATGPDEMSRFALLWLQSRYVLSEQVVRFLVEGGVSISEIEALLLAGRVLEEHRNPLRVPSYLVYGECAGRPLHLLCSDGLNGQLAILIAYVPALPLWASPTRRNARGGNTMTESVGSCFFCGGELVEIVIGNYYYRREGRMCVVKSLPATLCRQCDEKYLNAEVAGRLNELIDRGSFSGTEEALVIDYPPASAEP